MRFLVPFILFLGLIGAVAIGMHGTRPPAEFRFISRGSIHTLDPASMSYMQDIHVADSLWEGLMRLDPKTTLPIPGVAEKPPEISEDKKRYLFTLREDARWSNGDPVTAHDFVRGWRRAIEPGTAETYSELISAYIEGLPEYAAWRTKAVGLISLIRQLQHHEVIKGDAIREALLADSRGILKGHLRTPIPTPPPDEANPFWSQAANELETANIPFDQLGDELLRAHIGEMAEQFNKVGLHALDDRHLEIRLKLPIAYYLDLTAFSTYLPIHSSIELLQERYKDLPLTAEGLWTYDPQWTKPDYHRNGYPGLISNGAYQLERWDFKQSLRLKDNSYYWDRAHVRSKTIDVLDIAYQNAGFMLYSQHQIDFFMDMVMDYTPNLVQQENKGLRDDIHPVAAFGTYYLTLNCRDYLLDGQPNPLVDPRIRRALTRSIDRRSIAENIERLNNPISTTFVPQGQIPGYPSPKGLDYNPELARQELAAAGHPKGEGLPPLELLFNTDSGHEGKMQAIKRMWEQELGLKIQLVAKETKAFAEDKDRGRFMIGRGGWFGDYNDPTTFLDLFQTDNGNNVGKFTDAKYDGLLAQAARELDPHQRFAILSEAEKYLMEEKLPIVPIYTYVNVYAWRPTVTGIYPNPRLQFPLQYMAVEHRN